MKPSKATIVSMSEEERLVLKEKYSNLIGYHNNRLTIEDIIGRDPRHVLYVKARCVCGESICVTRSAVFNSSVKSCGCLNKEISKTSQEYRVPNLIGRVFSDLTVERRLSLDERVLNGTGAQWLCRCKCNRIRYATTGELNSGAVKSCKVCSRINKYSIDLSGKVVNNIEIIEKVGKNYRNSAMWKCFCRLCGEYFVTSAAVLLHANPFSCGCVSSRGEQIIAKFLKDNNIYFVRQKTFPTCKNKNRLRFDFWLPEYGTRVEYDGIQHYKKSNEWDSDEKFATRKKNDSIKDQWCAGNDVILIRIPYNQTDNIEPILRDWLFLYEE